MAFGVLQRVTQALLPEAVTPAGLLAQGREGRASQTESPGPPPVPLPAHPLLVATQKLSKNYNPVPNGVCLEATHEKETRALRITASSYRSRDRAEDKGRVNGPPVRRGGARSRQHSGSPSKRQPPHSGRLKRGVPGGACQSPVGSWTARSSEHAAQRRHCPGSPGVVRPQPELF